MNKILRNRRNIAGKNIRRYTYKTTRILASNNPRELDFVLDNSYDNALYTFNLINDHMNVWFMNFHENHKNVKNRGKLKGYTNKFTCLLVVNIHKLFKIASNNFYDY